MDANQEALMLRLLQDIATKIADSNELISIRVPDPRDKFIDVAMPKTGATNTDGFVFVVPLNLPHREVTFFNNDPTIANVNITVECYADKSPVAKFIFHDWSAVVANDGAINGTIVYRFPFVAYCNEIKVYSSNTDVPNFFEIISRK